MPEESFAPGNGRGAVLLLHGFTGTPFDVEAMAGPLVAAGFAVSTLRLPGHGVAPPPGERNDSAAWLADAEAGLERLVTMNGGHAVAVVGLSMGGLLALQLAARHPQRVERLVALAPALQVSTQLALLFGTLRVVACLGPSSWLDRRIEKGPSNIVDPEARVANPSSPPFALRTMLAFDDLRRETRELVGRVRAPTLILHGRLDGTIPLAASEWLRREIGATHVEMQVLEQSAHVLPLDRERAQVAAHVTRFLLNDPSAD